MKKVILAACLAISSYGAVFNVSTVEQFEAALTTSASNTQSDTINLGAGVDFSKNVSTAGCTDLLTSASPAYCVKNYESYDLTITSDKSDKAQIGNSYGSSYGSYFGIVIDYINPENSNILKFENIKFSKNGSHYGVLTNAKIVLLDNVDGYNTSYYENIIYPNQQSTTIINKSEISDTTPLNFSNTIYINSIFKSYVSAPNASFINCTFAYAGNSSKSNLMAKNIINTLFVDNYGFGKDDIQIAYSQSKVINTYFDGITKANFMTLELNNITPKEEDIVFADFQYNIHPSSPTIDKGLSLYSQDFQNIFEDQQVYELILELMKKDYNGNPRIMGKDIDIGAIESLGETNIYSALPQISSLTYSGTPYVNQELTFDFTVLNDSSNFTYGIDFGTGTFTPITDKQVKHTFDTAGTQTVIVKIVTADDKVVTKSIDVEIVDIFSLTSNAILAKGIEIGKYLATENTKLGCLANPLSCGIIPQGKWEKSQLDSQESGWTLLGTASTIDDMSLFADIALVWAYKDGAWEVYSSDEATQTIIKSYGNKILDTIDGNKGFWIYKE